MPASKQIQAEIVVTYPGSKEGLGTSWETLALSEVQARYLADSLDFALGRLNGKSKENPKAYAE